MDTWLVLHYENYYHRCTHCSLFAGWPTRPFSLEILSIKLVACMNGFLWILHVQTWKHRKLDFYCSVTRWKREESPGERECVSFHGKLMWHDSHQIMSVRQDAKIQFPFQFAAGMRNPWTYFLVLRSKLMKLLSGRKNAKTFRNIDSLLLAQQFVSDRNFYTPWPSPYLLLDSRVSFCWTKSNICGREIQTIWLHWFPWRRL